MKLTVADHDSPEYEAAFALRDEVLRKPLGMKFDESTREADESRSHCVAIAGGVVVGVALIGDEGDGVARISSVAVAEDQQGTGVGQALIEFAEGIAREKGAVKAVMDSRDLAVGFYEKLGYTTVGGGFVKVGIPHRRMEKELPPG